MTGHEHDDRATPRGRDAGEHEYQATANHSKERPAAPTEQDPSSPSGRALLGSDPAVFPKSHPARLAKIEEAMRRYGGDDHRAEVGYCPPGRFWAVGAFEGLGFGPTDQEVRQAQRRVVARWTLPADVFEKGPSAWPPSLPPPVEDGGAVNCCTPLHRAWQDHWFKDERDPEVLRYAVAADSYVCFVPTVEDIVRAMRIKGVEPVFASEHKMLQEDNLATTTPEQPTSELERAMRRAQRAPGPLWPGNSGSPNKLQEWVQAKGRKQYSHNRTLTLQEVITDLMDKGYLDAAPPGEQVKEVLDKMISEIEEAEARNHERVWRGRR